ncbi:MAG TPA: MMPL family transporter, partial [Propionibacteriaceae bacterium]|nr:MMPL family transporter [Propionibacteriaceae bacterium]
MDTTRAPRTSTWIRIAALLVVVTWLGIGSVGGQSMGKLSSVQENGAGAFLPADTESSVAALEARAFAEGEGLPAFLLVAREGGLTPADFGVLQAFAQGVPALPLEGGGTMADLLTSTEVAVIPSEDGEAVLIPISLDADAVSGEVNGEAGITAFSTTFDEAVESDLRSTGLTANVTGPGGYAADFGRAFAGIDGILLLVARVVVFVILVLVYRSPILPIVVLTSAVMGLSAAGLVVYELAKRGLLEVSGQSQGILA